MMCYRDRTFCPYYETCSKSQQNGGECSKGLTPEVEKNAARLGFDIARWLEKPSCFIASQPSTAKDE